MTSVWLLTAESDRVAPAGERRRGAGHFHVHGGHGETLTLFFYWAAAAVQEHLSHLLPEVGVEEAVDDGVDAGGWHGQQVAEGEQQVVVADGQSLLVPVWHHVEDGERQPAESKGRDEGDQHDVDAAAVGHALTLWGPGAVQHFFAVAKADKNSNVTEQDQRQWTTVLEEQEPCGVSEPVLLGWPVLQTGLHMWRGGVVRKEVAGCIWQQRWVFWCVGNRLRWRCIEIGLRRSLVIEWSGQDRQYVSIGLICEELKG